jgi:F-box and WD-40 domain protein CDC4
VIRCHASHIFIANVDCTIGVYDIETGQTQKILRGHASGVHSLEVVRQTLVSGSSDHTIRVWDLKTLTLRHILRGHEATVRLLGIVDPGLDPATGRMEPECSVIVTGSSDSTVRTWRLPEEQTETAQPDSTYLMQTFTGHTGPITAMAIHTRICVSGSDDCTVRLWDMARGQCTGVFRRHTDRSE